MGPTQSSRDALHRFSPRHYAATPQTVLCTVHQNYVGKLLSCFVNERKHKCVKDIALHVLWSFEHTVIHDVVNQQMEQLINGVDIYKDKFLVRPSFSQIRMYDNPRQPCSDVAS